jgi:hypothetical protein
MSVFAIEITVTETNCGGGLTQPQCDSLTQEVRNELNNNLPDEDAQKYADGTANATVIANAGKGSDYGQNFDIFTLKVSGGVGLDASTSGLDDMENANGFAVGGGITAGVNLDLLPINKIGFIDFSKMDLFLNYSSFNVDQEFDQATAKGSIGGFGFMARYSLIESKDIPSKYLMQWGGLHLHTGFQRSTMDINYNQSFDDQEVSAQGGALSGKFSNARGVFDLKSETNVIPIEVSTYMRFLYVFTLYGGAGMDIASGTSDIKFDGTGTVTGGASPGSTDYQASLSANESASGSPETTNFRGFIGLQFNVPVVSVYVHVNKNISKDIVGANVGVNFAW